MPRQTRSNLINPMESVRPLLLVAAFADFVAVFVHGYIGHRLYMTPLRRVRLWATDAIGDEDITWRVFAVTFHVVTATFACSGIALLLAGFGTLPGTSLPRTLAAMHASFLLVAAVIIRSRIAGAWRRPIPIGFATIMSTVLLAGWFGAS